MVHTSILPFVPLAVMVLPPAIGKPVAFDVVKTRAESGGNVQAGKPVILLDTVMLPLAAALYSRMPFRPVNAKLEPIVVVRLDSVVTVEFDAIVIDGSRTPLA